jgi:hypothetical protein
MLALLGFYCPGFARANVDGGRAKLGHALRRIRTRSLAKRRRKAVPVLAQSTLA